MTRLSLTPLYRHSVGFDRFNDLFDSLLGEPVDNGNAYPPYNIEKYGDNEYKIVMAVAGFGQDDLNIISHGNTLTIAGRVEKADDQNTPEFLHKGIANRAFERKFSLADHVKVTDADLSDGLLKISLLREVPEEHQPKMIQISNGTGSKKKTIETKAKKTN